MLEFSYNVATTPEAPVLPVLVSQAWGSGLPMRMHLEIDTGSFITAIPVSKLESVSARKVDFLPVVDFKGNRSLAPVYEVKLELSDLVLPCVRVIGLNSAYALLGLDILNQLLATLDGPRRITRIG